MKSYIGLYLFTF